MAGTNILVRQKDLIAGSGISITPDTTSGNVTIAATNTAIDEARLLPETGSVSSDSVGNPVIFKTISRIDNTYWLCLPLNEDTNDRSTYDVATEVYGTVNIVSNAPSSPGGSAFFNGSSCLHGTLPAQFGTSDFTVRLWMMAPELGSSSQTIFSTRYGDQTDESTFALLCTTEGRLFIYSNGDITSRTDTPFTLQPSVWYHVAVVRKSGVLTIYVNGEVYNSATFTNSLTRQIFGLGASWTGSSYSEAGTVYLTSLDVLNYAAYDGAFTTPAYQPGILAGMGYAVATDSEVTDMLSAAGIDESRLLPKVDSIPTSQSGHALVYDYQSGIDADTLCLLHLDDSTWADATGKNTITQHGNVAKVSDSGYFNKALDLSGNQSSGSLSWLTVPWLAEYEAATWTMEFFAKPTKSVVNFMFFSFGNSQNQYLSLGSQNLENLWFGNGSDQFTGDFSFSTGTWYWIVMQYDGTSMKVYVDGQLVVQGNFTPNMNEQDLQFGNLNLVNNQDNTFIGYLDEFRWSKGLRYPTGVMTLPTEPFGASKKKYKVSDVAAVTEDNPRLLPENPANGDIPCFDATATVGGGNDANTRILLHFDADEIKDEAAGNAAPVTITKKTGTITVVEGGKWGKCAKYVTGSMTVATNLDELNANNWVVSGWFNPDENNHGVSYPTWLSMDDQNTHGFGFDSTGRYGESDGPLFYLDTPPASGTWHWLAIVKYSGGLRFYLNGAFLNEISAQQRANFCSTLAIGGFAGTHAAGSTERTFSGLVDEVRLQYIPDDEITLWTGTSIAVPDAPYSKPQTVGKWGKFNKATIPVLEAEPVDGNLMLYTTQTFNVSDTMHLLHFDDPDQWFKDETGNYTGAATRSYYAFSTNITKFGTGGLQYQDPNGTSEYKTRSFNIANIGPLKGPQDAVTLEFWFYIDQSCIFEIPDIMAKKGTAVEHWNFHLVNKMIYPDDIATPVKDVAVLSYHDFDEVSTYTKVETPWSRPTISEGWHHFAFCRDSAYNHYVFLDGAMLLKVLGSQFGSSPYLCPIVPDATTSSIGCDLSFDTQVLCYQDELRYSSVCLYTKNFVPPSEPFTYDAEAANKDVTGWFPASPGVIGLITGINNLIPSASGQLTIPEASKTFPGLMSATDKGKLDSFNITESKARPGYFKLPGGTIVQWGAASNITADGSTQITFPVAFPNAFLIGNATTVSGNASASGVVVSLTAVTVTGMTLIIKNHPGNSNDINVHWLAIGY